MQPDDRSHEEKQKSVHKEHSRKLTMRYVAVGAVLLAVFLLFLVARNPSTDSGTSDATSFSAIDNESVPASEFSMVLVETKTKESKETFASDENVSVELSFTPREGALGEQKIRLQLVNKTTGQGVYDNTLPALDVDDPVVLSFPPSLEPARYVAILSMNDIVLGEQEFNQQ